MDLRNFKEAFINISEIIYNTFINSSFFYILKERYNHLSVIHKKIINHFILLSFLISVFYYPVIYFYSSLTNMRDFNIKKNLVQKLVNLSTTTKSYNLKSYTKNKKAVNFIKNKIKTLNIPPSQIKKIQKTNIKLQDFNFSAHVESVEVILSNLNLKQIIQYGHQLEKLSSNIKLTKINIQESKNKNNYFNTTYVLSFFSVSKNYNLKKKPLKTKPLKTKTLKTKTLKKTKIPNKKSLDVKLLNVTKKNIKAKGSDFKNYPKGLKKRDLLPPLPTPKIKKVPLLAPPKPPKLRK